MDSHPTCPWANFPDILGQQATAQDFSITTQISSPTSHMGVQDPSTQEGQTILLETVTEDTQGLTVCL